LEGGSSKRKWSHRDRGGDDQHGQKRRKMWLTLGMITGPGRTPNPPGHGGGVDVLRKQVKGNGEASLHKKWGSGNPIRQEFSIWVVRYMPGDSLETDETITTLAV